MNDHLPEFERQLIAATQAAYEAALETKLEGDRRRKAGTLTEQFVREHLDRLNYYKWLGHNTIERLGRRHYL